MAILSSIIGYFPDYDFSIPNLYCLPFYNEDLSKSKPETVLNLIENIDSSNGIVVIQHNF